MSRIPSHLDRYPAKMVSRFASDLFDRYGVKDTSESVVRVFDPFCGSGAILAEGASRGLAVTGADISPFAQLLSEAKLGPKFSSKVVELVDELVQKAEQSRAKLPIRLPHKEYWFGSVTIDRIERLRAQARRMRLVEGYDGRVVMLALALSMRLCSFADQRSPKPFISRYAREHRVGRSFDPFQIVRDVVAELVQVYRQRLGCGSTYSLHQVDITSSQFNPIDIGQHSHVLTSPPYINAQDYFRNSKFELYVLEGVLPFEVDDIRSRFVGTERLSDIVELPEEYYSLNIKFVPNLLRIERRSKRLANVVHQYLWAMYRAFCNISKSLRRDGTLVLVCGDNIVAGIHICTWEVLAKMLAHQGYEMFDKFSDPIKNRCVPPQRKGHKGLIKEEVVCAFNRR